MESCDAHLLQLYPDGQIHLYPGWYTFQSARNPFGHFVHQLQTNWIKAGMDTPHNFGLSDAAVAFNNELDNHHAPKS